MFQSFVRLSCVVAILALLSGCDQLPAPSRPDGSTAGGDHAAHAVRL